MPNSEFANSSLYIVSLCAIANTRSFNCWSLAAREMLAALMCFSNSAMRYCKVVNEIGQLLHVVEEGHGDLGVVDAHRVAIDVVGDGRRDDRLDVFSDQPEPFGLLTPG